ncbi:MAG: repressor LexA [Gammaproteobacteria bacterium]|nr:repressor LexA [Gammaproteobacteria bacterium]
MLTKKQYQVLKVIDHYIKQHGYAPTYEEIANAIGVTAKGPITKYIKTLEEQGYLERMPNMARALRLKKALPELEQNGFPLVGKIAAGKPIMAFENIEHVDLNQHLAGRNKRYFLEVQGESMRDIGILPGDWVLIQAQQIANNNDIVVALVDGYEATLKRFRRDDSKTVSLIPENKEMQAMTFPADQVQIQGILVAQLRHY